MTWATHGVDAVFLADVVITTCAPGAYDVRSVAVVSCRSPEEQSRVAAGVGVGVGGGVGGSDEVVDDVVLPGTDELVEEAAFGVDAVDELDLDAGVDPDDAVDDDVTDACVEVASLTPSEVCVEVDGETVGVASDESLKTPLSSTRESAPWDVASCEPLTWDDAIDACARAPELRALCSQSAEPPMAMATVAERPVASARSPSLPPKRLRVPGTAGVDSSSSGCVDDLLSRGDGVTTQTTRASPPRFTRRQP
jgi:hypothetical protein